jgi:2-haloalkanoic acid dehalogenase type II
MSIKAVSLDAYGTLFDFEDQLSTVIEQVLPPELVGKVDSADFASDWGRAFHKLYDDFGSNWRLRGQTFKNIEQLTVEAMEAVLEKRGYAIDPILATSKWLESLHAVKIFPEVKPVLKCLEGNCAIALLSDTDDAVILPALENLNWDFDFIITSETEQAYKFDPDGILFKKAARKFGLPPEQVLHVGDSPADIRGAAICGMQTVWVNRHRRSLPANCPVPDWEMTDLCGLTELLGLPACNLQL